MDMVKIMQKNLAKKKKDKEDMVSKA